MPKVDWSSLIADENGKVDFMRVKSLAAVLLALAAGFVAVAGTAIEVFTNQEIYTDAMLITLGALVVPLTGGLISAGFQMRKNG